MAMESLTLNLSMEGPKSKLKSTRFVPKRVYIFQAEIAEENNGTTSFREKGSLSCRHICSGKQLLPQINSCCQEVMQIIR